MCSGQKPDLSGNISYDWNNSCFFNLKQQYKERLNTIESSPSSFFRCTMNETSADIGIGQPTTLITGPADVHARSVDGVDEISWYVVVAGREPGVYFGA